MTDTLTRLKTIYERAYPHLPIALQNAALSTVGWHNGITCRGRGFARLLDEYEARTFADPGEIQELRDARLSAFLLHAYETVPYYRDLFDDLALHPSDITTLDDLAELPILSKATVRERQRSFVSTSIPSRRRKLITTGGTTGSALILATTIEAVQEQWAVAWRYFRWHGIEPKTWAALFGNPVAVPIRQKKPPFWRYDLAGRQIVFSSVHTSTDNLRHYVSELRKRKPPWIHGLASQITLLASHLIDTKTDLGYETRWITTSSENFLPQHKDLIEKVFGVRPREHYAMVEAMANISECELGKLHVDEEFGAVEFVPVNGSKYKVVGTNLTNPVTPLIRYDCHDQVTITPGDTCSCGRPGRVISSIDGRQEDYVVLKDGTRLGRLEHLFYSFTTVSEVQIRQSTIGEIQVLVRRLTSFTKDDDRRLRQEISKWIRDGSRVTVEYVDEIERTPGGKLRFVVSSLDPEEAAGYEAMPQVALDELAQRS